MRKKKFTLVHLIGISSVLGITAAIVIPIVFTKPKLEKEVTATGKSYDWSYPFPSADEFGESDHYSMVWIGESAWIWKRFLLVEAKETHKDYGCLPYLLKAISDVERKGYVIVSKEFVTTRPFLSDPIERLLLEIRPSENTENTGKRHP